MKIMMLAQSYPPLIGGEERHVGVLSAALVERGHEVTVVTLATRQLPAREIVAGVDVRRIGSPPPGSGSAMINGARHLAPPSADRGLARRIAEIVREVRPTVIHAHDWLVHSALRAVRGTTIPVALTIHDHSPVCAKKKLILDDDVCPGPSLARCLPCAAKHYGGAKGSTAVVSLRASSASMRRVVDRFIPVSQAVADDNGLTGSDLPFEIIPNFVPDDLGIPDAIPQRVAESMPVGPFTLFVGAFGRHKGVEVLARAHAHTRTPTVVIGYTSREHTANEAGFPFDLIVRTNWAHEEVMAAWGMSSIAVVPSTWSDPCPTVALEAMACAKPVIASAIGGLPDIVVHGETGLLVPPGDHVALADAIRELEADPDRQHRMGQAGLARVARFRAAVVVDRLETVYDRLVEMRRPESAVQ